MSHKRNSTEFYGLKQMMGDSVASHLNQQPYDDDDSEFFDDEESLGKSGDNEDEYEESTDSGFYQTEESEYETGDEDQQQTYRRNQQSFSVYQQPNDDVS